MKRIIEKLGRSVELDDALVKEYEKYGPLTDSSFVIVLLSRYGHAPSEDELSDGELSQICNDVLLSELKTYTLVPETSSFQKRYDLLPDEQRPAGAGVRL